MPKQEMEKLEMELKVVVDWSELQPELVDSISKKLTQYVDYVRFRAVCVKWRSAVSPNPQHLLVQLPWLMLTHPFIENFVSLSENKIHRLNLSGTIHSETRCVGSSLGWIALVDKTPNILLFNPITRIQFQLPPLTTFPNVLDYNVHNVDQEYLIYYTSVGQRPRRSSDDMRDYAISKVVLSSSPSSSKNEDFVAVAIFNIHRPRQLAFCKKGDESWTLIDDADFYFEDVIFYKGLFYAINSSGWMAICDVSGFSPLVTIIEPSLPISRNFYRIYLVDSFGELLLVTRYTRPVRHSEVVFKTSAFDVFTLDSSMPKWVAVESLGDRILFLGTNSSSLCLLATDLSGCERNHIYFTNDNNKLLDSGVFNVGDGSIEPLPHCPVKTRLIWVTPNPC